MRCWARLVLIALLSATGLARAGINEWTSVGPAQTAYSVAAVGSPTVLYASTWQAGAFRSTNGGADWEPFDVPFLVVDFWRFTPADPLRIYAGFLGFVATSDDGGEDWHHTHVPEWHGLTALAVDPVTPSTVYAVAGTEALYRSVNGGFDYEPIGVGSTPFIFRGRLLIDPTLPSRMYMQAGEGGYRSLDGGEHWTRLRLPTLGGPPLAMDPATPTTLYGCGGDPIVPTTHRSIDAGETWEAHGGPCPAIIKDLFVAAGDPQRLWGGWTSAYTSRDAGGHWYHIGRGLTEGYLASDDMLVPDPNDPRRLWAATRDKGVMVYDDRCGNGAPDAHETCDDGNAVDGDGCRPDCTLEVHGDGYVDPDEECDDGNVVSGDGCDENFRRTGCGNGIVTRGEVCDDGNDVAGDGCNVCMVGCVTDQDCATGDPCVVGTCVHGSCGEALAVGDQATVCSTHAWVLNSWCGAAMPAKLESDVRAAADRLADAVAVGLDQTARQDIARTFRRLARRTSRVELPRGCARRLRARLLLMASLVRG